MLLFEANGYMQECVAVTLAYSLQWAFMWLITAHFGQIFVFFLKICVSDFNGVLLFGMRHGRPYVLGEQSRVDKALRSEGFDGVGGCGY